LLPDVTELTVLPPDVTVSVVPEVVLLSTPTTSERALAVLVLRLVSPGYAALRLFVPNGNAVVAKVATPLVFNVPVPSEVLPL
jgi:hypothetical protein